MLRRRPGRCPRLRHRHRKYDGTARTVRLRITSTVANPQLDGEGQREFAEIREQLPSDVTVSLPKPKEEARAVRGSFDTMKDMLRHYAKSMQDPLTNLNTIRSGWTVRNLPAYEPKRVGESASAEEGKKKLRQSQ